MNPFPLVVPGLLGIEAVFVLLRLRHIIIWRWWMMTPLWLGAGIFLMEIAAAVTVVTIVRDLLHWILP